MKTKRTYIPIIIIGLLIILASTLSDTVGKQNDYGIGPAQLLGMQFGALLVVVGIGFLTVSTEDWTSIKKPFKHLIDTILDLPPSFWVVATFLTLYIMFFISPVFFEKSKIQYFVKYIPYEWVTHTGFDIEWTVEDINRWLLDKQSSYNLYAPLTTILLSPLILIGFPKYYQLIVIITLLSFIVSTLLVPIFIGSRRNYAIILLLFFAGLFSYGFQFELDRGQFNLIAFGACIVAIYIFHFQNDYRYFAYGLFSIAIQLKIYPVFFTLMFIENWRDWKNNARRILGLGIFNFSLLFLLGYQPFIDFVKMMTSIQLNFTSSRSEDLSIKGFVYNLTTDGFKFIPPEILFQLNKYSGQIELLFLILFGLCILSIVIYAYANNLEGFNPFLLVVSTIGALIIPSMSFDYKLPMLIAPMAITLSSLPRTDGTIKKSIKLFLIIVISMAFWSTFYPFTIKPYIISRNFPALIIILLSITVLYYLIPYTIKRPNRISANSSG